MKKIISFEKKVDFPSMIGEVSAISLDHNLKFIDDSNISGDLRVTGKYKMTEASRLEEDFDYSLPVEIMLTERLDLDTAKVGIDDFYYEIENNDTMVYHIDVKVEGVEIIDEVFENTNKSDNITTENITKDTLLESDINSDTDRIDELVLKELSDDLNREDITNTKEESPVVNSSNNITDQPIKPDNPSSDINQFIIPDKVNKELDLSTSIEKVDGVRECDGDYDKETECNTMQEDTNIEDVGSLFSSFKDADETFATYSVYIVRQEETVQTIIDKFHTTKEELEKYNDLANLSIGTKIIIPTTNE